MHETALRVCTEKSFSCKMLLLGLQEGRQPGVLTCCRLQPVTTRIKFFFLQYRWVYRGPGRRAKPREDLEVTERAPHPREFFQTTGVGAFG